MTNGHIFLLDCLKSGQRCNGSFAYAFCYWLAVSSVAWNPFVYCSMGDDFRRAFRKLFPYKLQFVKVTNATGTTSTGGATSSSSSDYSKSVKTTTTV